MLCAFELEFIAMFGCADCPDRRGSPTKSGNLQQSSRKNDALEFERTQATNEGSRFNCHWLEVEHIPKGHGEQIILEARRSLASAEHKKSFQKSSAARCTN